MSPLIAALALLAADPDGIVATASPDARMAAAVAALYYRAYMSGLLK